MLAAASEIPARRSGRNTRAAHGANSPIVPKRHPQMAQSPRQSRKAAVPTPSRVADGGLFAPLKQLPLFSKTEAFARKNSRFFKLSFWSVLLTMYSQAYRTVHQEESICIPLNSFP